MQETSLEAPVTVFDIPEATCRRHIAERLNVSLHFPAADWLVLADGAGLLYLLATGDRRTHTDPWQVQLCMLCMYVYYVCYVCTYVMYVMYVCIMLCYSS